jgi:hypothetical protein
MTALEQHRGVSAAGRSDIFFTIPLFLIFAGSLFLPATHQLLKLPLFGLAVFSAICFILCSGNRLFLHRTTVLWILFYASVGVVWIGLGVINRTPGAIPVATIFLIWPLAYSLFINQLNGLDQFKRLMFVFFLVTALSIVADVGYLGEMLGLVPGDFFQLLGNNNRFGVTAAGPSYSSNRVGLNLFTIPLLVSLLVYRRVPGEGRNMSALLWGLLISLLVLTLISQRRAIYLVAFLSPFIALFLHGLLPRRIDERSRAPQFLPLALAFVVLLVWLFFVGVFEAFNWQALGQDFVDAFNFEGTAAGGNYTENVRPLQLWALLEGWSQTPWVGAGHGANVELIRSGEMPWAYELTYVALLYQTGVLGFLAYFAGVVWIVLHLIQIMRSAPKYRLYAYALLNGLIGFLLGSATNPYLLSFDFLWTIFVPAALVNLYLYERDFEQDMLLQATATN